MPLAVDVGKALRDLLRRADEPLALAIITAGQATSCVAGQKPELDDMDSATRGGSSSQSAESALD
jgi:hypothetical protein